MHVEKIKIPEHMEKFVGQLREEKGFKSNAEVVEYLLPIAASRLNATRNYAKSLKAKTPTKPKAEKKAKAAKPAKAKKVAAKGPLARKQASKAKAPRVRKAKAAPSHADLAAHDAATSGATPAPAAEPVLD